MIYDIESPVITGFLATARTATAKKGASVGVDSSALKQMMKNFDKC